LKYFTKKPKHIVLHTAAYRGKTDAKLIAKWHLEKEGWDTIGYHVVITGSIFDDEAVVQFGRPMQFQGAHAKFFNGRSLGICVTGHGDHIEWTTRQLDLLAEVVITLMKAYDIPVYKVIGHRDTPWERLKRFKTCPGTLIDMNEVRKHIMSKMKEVT